MHSASVLLQLEIEDFDFLLFTGSHTVRLLNVAYGCITDSRNNNTNSTFLYRAQLYRTSIAKNDKHLFRKY